MGKYSDYFKKAENVKNVSKIGDTRFRFTKAGEEVIGKIMSIKKVQPKKFKKPVNLYTIDTDSGIQEVMLSAIYDERLSSLIGEGDIVKIVYLGLQKGKGRRQYHQFDVLKVNEENKKK